MVRGHMPTYHGLSNIQTNRGFFFDFQYTVFYTDMPQRSPIFHRQPHYATNIISDMHIEISPSEEAYREDIDMCSRCDVFVLTLTAHISRVLRKYLNILRIPPEFSAVQCISFFRFGRVSYYAFYTYHTNIGNVLLNIEDISYMLPRIANILHIGGKAPLELGENGLSSCTGDDDTPLKT